MLGFQPASARVASSQGPGHVLGEEENVSYVQVLTPAGREGPAGRLQEQGAVPPGKTEKVRGLNHSATVEELKGFKPLKDRVR